MQRTPNRSRRRRGAGERAQLAAEYLKSGEDLAGFARRAGVATASVLRWVKESACGGRAERPRLVPVVVSPELPGEQVEVALADGTALRVSASMAPERLGALVAAVRQAC